jgi:hypothetical protein
MRNATGDHGRDGRQGKEKRGDNKLNETHEARGGIKQENERWKAEQEKRKGKDRRQNVRGIESGTKKRGRG